MNRTASTTTLIMLALVVVFGCSKGIEVAQESVPQKDATYIVSSEQHAKGLGWKKKDCFMCHLLSKIDEVHLRAPNIGKTLKALGNDADLACMACHGPNGLTEEEGGVRRCLICHSRPDLFTSAPSFSKLYQHNLKGEGMNDKVCIICHERSDMNGKFDINVDLTRFSGPYKSVNDFCLDCHDINGAAGILPPPLKFDPEFRDLRSTYMGFGSTGHEIMITADTHGAKDGDPQLFGVFRGKNTYGVIVLCTECHYPHSSSNPYLITESGSSALNTDEQGKKASVRVTKERFSELCAVCHTNQNGVDAGNGLKEVVHTGFALTDCTDCHFHGAGYGLLKNNLF